MIYRLIAQGRHVSGIGNYFCLYNSSVNSSIIRIVSPIVFNKCPFIDLRCAAQITSKLGDLSGKKVLNYSDNIWNSYISRYCRVVVIKNLIYFWSSLFTRVNFVALSEYIPPDLLLLEINLRAAVEHSVVRIVPNYK